MAASRSIFDTSRPLMTMHRYTKQVYPGFRDRPVEWFSDSDSDEDNQPEVWDEFPVNLRSFDGKRLGKPIYTRELLTEVAAKLEEARSPTSPGQEIRIKDIYGVHRIIFKRPHGQGSSGVQINFLNQVELAPDFLAAYMETSDAMAELQHLNDAKDTIIPSPVVFTSCNLKRDEPPSATGLRQCMKIMSGIKSLWLNSVSQKKLCSQVFSLHQRGIRIKKIVCFGLGGNFQPSKDGYYQPVLQHMAAFTIAAILNRYQKSKGEASSEDSRIQLFFQDPSYNSFDKAVLAALYGPDAAQDLHFVSDPHGFLAVDSETLVMTAFLPKVVPLLQILADLSISSPSHQPAAMICDKMVLDPSKELYPIERATPSVVRFLNSGYNEEHFEDHGIEEELWTRVCAKCPYWLWSMNLWIRKEADDRKDSGAGMEESLKRLEI